MKKVIATKNAPAAIGPYSQAVQVGNMLFASGQLGLDPATGNFAEGGVKEQTVQAFKNVHAILEEAGLSINDVVKTTVFLADMSDFAAMNEVYASQFEGTFPARSAVAVKTLPKNGLVEIEVIAVKELVVFREKSQDADRMECLSVLSVSSAYPALYAYYCLLGDLPPKQLAY